MAKLSYCTHPGFAGSKFSMPSLLLPTLPSILTPRPLALPTTPNRVPSSKMGHCISHPSQVPQTKYIHGLRKSSNAETTTSTKKPAKKTVVTLRGIAWLTPAYSATPARTKGFSVKGSSGGGGALSWSVLASHARAEASSFSNCHEGVHSRGGSWVVGCWGDRGGGG